MSTSEDSARREVRISDVGVARLRERIGVPKPHPQQPHAAPRRTKGWCVGAAKVRLAEGSAAVASQNKRAAIGVLLVRL